MIMLAKKIFIVVAALLMKSEKQQNMVKGVAVATIVVSLFFVYKIFRNINFLLIIAW